MKIVVGSDGKSAATQATIDWLKKSGHDVSLYGALNDDPEPWHWPKVAEMVATKVAQGEASQGILFCWTGTGVAMAANKVSGVRAALCCDAEIAKGARVWNDANLLVMSIRNTSEEIAREILKAWFSAKPSAEMNDQTCIAHVKSMDE